MPNKRFSKALLPLFFLSVFCFSIDISRLLITGSIHYQFFIWNLVLAWVPLIVAHQFETATKRWHLLVLFFMWFLFFPNAPYIITDFMHLRPRDNFPFWFDVILICSFAFTGLLLGIISALIIYSKLKQLIQPLVAKGLMFLAMFISGYGIYIGRFLRYNSWDIVTSPMCLFQDSWNILVHPFTYPGACGVTVTSGVLLCLVFLLFEALMLRQTEQL